MEFRNATPDDFEIAFDYIQKLWTYNTYDKNELFAVYTRVLASHNNFAFFLLDDGKYRGFCHGIYFDTFWMSGLTCYISGIITNSDDHGKGYGIQIMNHVKELAKNKGCKALLLDSGFPRENAHRFYEKYGFEKSCYGFELIL